MAEPAPDPYAPRAAAVVDDDADDRALVARALRREFPAAAIVEVNDAASLDAALARDDLDVWITDYQLLWTDGLAVVAAAKARAPETPVIMFTNTGSEQIAVDAMKAGVFDYIVKEAYQYARLPSVVRSALELREARRAERRRRDEARAHELRLEALLREVSASEARERAARREAEHAGRLKDEFLAAVSHELRTPLNAILGWSSILTADAGALPPNARRGLATIERNARAQLRLVEDLLDAGRLATGTLALDPRPLDLAAALVEAVEAIAPAAAAKRVRLRASAAEPGVGVLGDAMRLQQVFVNLLDNAVKFSPEGGEVDVRLARAGADVEVAVADRGVGIDAAFLPHVFERFRQADGSTTRRHGGLGLGLSIVKELVELHGGGVRAESAGPGRGATFTVRLPLAAARSAAAPPAAPAARAEPLGGLVVVAVDDDLDACELVARALEHQGATVHTALSAAEAFELVLAHRPDVLVSDVGMPGEDGYALVARVRALGPERGGDVPAIAVTAFARVEDRERALAAGFQRHLAKPVAPSELVAAVARLARGAARRAEAGGGDAGG